MKDSSTPVSASKIPYAFESRKHLHEIFINAPVATAIYAGIDMVIELANNKMISYWGKDNSVIGTKLKDAVPELFNRPFLALVGEVFKTGTVHYTNEQFTNLQVEGKPLDFWFSLTYKPLFDADMNVYGVLHIAVDITQQVEARNKFILTEEKLRNVIEVANLGTWEYNVITEEVFLNAQLRRWRGITHKGNVTLNEILDSSPDKEFILDQLKAAILSEKERINVEYDFIHPRTGERRRFHSQGKVFFNEEKKPVLLTGITQDVTFQRLNEADMENNVAIKTAELAGANDDLRRLNANLEQFVYVASHDLQEPLRKINIFSDMLQNSSTDLSDESKMYLNKIEKAATRMSLLINDLLEFSRVSSKENTFIPTDLNRIISNVKIDYELLIKQKNAVIEIQALPVIEAIPLQMNQLFYNLIGNALKFSKTDVFPIITVSCRMLAEPEIIKYKLSPKMAFCNIMVKDNGIGFDKKYAEKIFEIFQRLHGKHQYAGTGIGLSLAKKIADNHGGLIIATSDENDGALFNVVLPITRE